MNSSPQEILQRYWNYSSFRPQQEEIISSLTDAKDVLAIMPTGGGKSLCYQVPAMMKEGLCLVISPLIALMKDQVSQLNEIGIPALALHSGMTAQEVKYTLQQATHGDCKLLYVSPERLHTKLFKDYLPALELNLIAVDEAHCISQWGYDFRPSYLQIAEIKNEIEHVPMIALTASATEKVQLDIIDKLELDSPTVIKQSFARPNLSYSVSQTDSKLHKLTDILQKVNGSAIVYCNSRKRTKEIAEHLQFHRISSAFYHAGLAFEERNKVQDAWMKNETRAIACTNAFGMGINKPDVRVVIHFDSPDCIENYYQEAGRAGRDGKTSFAVLLSEPTDIDNLRLLSDHKFPSVNEIKRIYQSLADFLHVPVGAGEGIYYDFDMKEFGKNFNLSILSIINALTVLQSEGFVHFNESVFQPSKIQFTTDHTHLEQFGNMYPESDDLIKVLLRTYAGILDEEINIYEKQIAKLLRWPTEKVEANLQQLQAYSIIRYVKRKETPQLSFVTNRAPSSYLNINEKNYALKKQLYNDRLLQMIAYTELKKECRSRFIANYFGEPLKEDCNVCDNCLSKKQEISADEFNAFSQKIMSSLAKGSIAIEMLLHQFQSKTKAKKVIEHMIAEEKLIMNSNNQLELKK